MQFSTFVKLALFATQLGIVTAIPSVLEERSFNGIFDNCTTDSDCGTGEYCYDGIILTFLDIPSLCIPTDWDLCASGSTDGTT
ncbi:hypothetical protein FKP32DRAFT_1587653, partial [Trametes sanguinea]